MSLLTYLDLVDLVDQGMIENLSHEQINGASIDVWQILVSSYKPFERATVFSLAVKLPPINLYNINQVYLLWN